MQFVQGKLQRIHCQQKFTILWKDNNGYKLQDFVTID